LIGVEVCKSYFLNIPLNPILQIEVLILFTHNFEKYCLVLGYSKSHKVEFWVKRMSTSSCKIGLRGTLRKELVLKRYNKAF
jgi:hypothetical protein